MNVIVTLLDIACGKPLASQDQGRARRLQLAIVAMLLALVFAAVWGVAVGMSQWKLASMNAIKVPAIVLLSSVFAVPAGLVTWKLSGAQCRGTDLLLGFAAGVFAGTLVLAVAAPLVALYYDSSLWAGPVLAQAAIAAALLTGNVVFVRAVVLRVEGKKRTVALPIVVFKVMQLASLLQLVFLFAPILPERTKMDRGIDGLAHAGETR